MISDFNLEAISSVNTFLLYFGQNMDFFRYSFFYLRIVAVCDVFSELGCLSVCDSTS